MAGKQKTMILGGAGFIATNLALQLASEKNTDLTLVDKDLNYFHPQAIEQMHHVSLIQDPMDETSDFESLLQGVDVLYHLVSTTVPTTSNKDISQELSANVILTSRLLEACVCAGVKKVIFISSGGTVYGKGDDCPIPEEAPTYPITAYGIQKITIEKLLYLFKYLHGLDYKVIRLANPYGPYQRPDGVQGAVTTFAWQALHKQPIIVYGDGSVVRDFIYIDDAVRGILQIASSSSAFDVYNLGSGQGTSIRQVLEDLQMEAGDLNITYKPGRNVDVPVNFLDISRFENEFGKLNPLSLQKGIRKTMDFMSRHPEVYSTVVKTHAVMADKGSME